MCRSWRRTLFRTTAPPTFLEVMIPNLAPRKEHFIAPLVAVGCVRSTPRTSHLPVTEDPFSRTLRKSPESFSRWTLRGFGSMR